MLFRSQKGSSLGANARQQSGENRYLHTSNSQQRTRPRAVLLLHTHTLQPTSVANTQKQNQVEHSSMKYSLESTPEGHPAGLSTPAKVLAPWVHSGQPAASPSDPRSSPFRSPLPNARATASAPIQGRLHVIQPCPRNSSARSPQGPVAHFSRGAPKTLLSYHKLDFSLLRSFRGSAPQKAACSQPRRASALRDGNV